MTLEKKLNEHVASCEEKFKNIDDRIGKLIDSQERCTSALEQLAKDTHGVVELYKNAQGVVTAGMGVQKLAIWITKWPIIGVGFYSIYQWLIEHGAK